MHVNYNNVCCYMYMYNRECARANPLHSQFIVVLT